MSTITPERIEEERLLDPDHKPTANELFHQRVDEEFAKLIADDDVLSEAFSIEAVPNWNTINGEAEHFNLLRYCLLQYRLGQKERAEEIGKYFLDNALRYLEDAAADRAS